VLLRQPAPASSDQRNSAQPGQTGQAEQAARPTPLPAAKLTNSFGLHAPALRDSVPPPAELRTVALPGPTIGRAAQLAQVRPNLALRVPLAARHGRKMIVRLVHRRALPQAQPAKAVRPRTVPSRPNPHGRSRNALSVQPGQSELLGQNAMPGQHTSAPLRRAAKLLRVKREFSMRTLDRCGRPTFTLKRLLARNARARPVRARPGPVQHGPARLGLMLTGPLPAVQALPVQARPGHTLTGLGPVSSGQPLRPVPQQPSPSAAKEVWRVLSPPAAANLARAVRGQAANRSGPGQAHAAHQTRVPATAPSGPMEQSPPAVLPVHPGLTLHEPRAHPTTARPRQSPIPAQPPVLREKPARDGSPSPGSPQTGLSLWGGSPALAAPANLHPAPALSPGLEAQPNPATELNPAEPSARGPVPAANRAERNADRNSPTAFRSGAVSCSP